VCAFPRGVAPIFFSDLEWRHDGAALHPFLSMVEFKVPAIDSLLWRIRNSHADSGGPKVEEDAT
jgi:hypothetical protein